MQNSTFYLKRGDTRPVLKLVLRNPDGTACNLSGADSATLHVQLDGGVFSREMEIDSDQITNEGHVTYSWLDGDWEGALPLEAGTFSMECEVITSGGARLTFPNAAEWTLSIRDDIADA